MRKYNVELMRAGKRMNLRVEATCFTNAVHQATSSVTYGAHHGWEILYIVRVGYELP